MGGGAIFMNKFRNLFTLFRFATKFDYVLLMLGTLASISHGVALPLAMHYFGILTNAFVNQFTSKQLANYEFSFDPNDFVGTGRFAVVDLNIILSGFINFTNITGGVVNCSEDYILLPPVITFDDALELGVTELADCLEDEMFITIVNRYVAVFIGIAYIVSYMGTLQIFSFQVSSDRQTKSIKESFFQSVLNQDATWFDGRSSGELSSRLSNDVERIREGIGDNLAIFIQWITTFFAGFLIGFIREWRLTLLLLGMTPFIATTVIISSWIIFKLTSLEQQQYALASAVVEEVLTSIRTVVAYGGEKIESDRYAEKLQAAKKTEKKRGTTASLSLGIIYFLIFVCYAIGFWFSAWLLSEEIIQAGDVLTVFFAVLIGIFSLGQAVPNLEKLVSAAGSSVAVYDIIQQKPASRDGSGDHKPERLDGYIEFVDIDFAYPTRPDTKVLCNFTLKVERGKTLALVGPSGCGKSTVIQLLLRFYEISKGQVLLGGHNIRSLDVKWLRSRFGFVGQEPVLFDASVAKNIGMGKEGATYEEIVSAAKDANAHEFSEGLPDGYNTSVGKQGTQMSGGQKQRIAIARALIRDPEILLLDDATSALDSESEQMVQKTLDQARAGRTTILVSHRMSTIMSADIIAFMEDGTITGVGTHEELMRRNGAYANLVVTELASESTARITHSDDVEDFEVEDCAIDVNSERSSAEMIEMEKISKDLTDDDKNLVSVKRKDGSGVSWMRVWQLNFPELWLIVLGIVGSAVQGAIYPAFAYFFGQVLRVYTLPFNQVLDNIHKWAVWFLVLGVLSGLSTFIKNICFFVSGSRLILRLRSSTFASILRQEMAWFDKKENSPSVLTSRLSNDAAQVQGATGIEFGTLIETVISMLVAIIISVIVDWLLSLVILGFLPFLIIPGLLQLYIVSFYTSRYKKWNDEAEKIAVDSINNHQTVRALSLEKRFIQSYRGQLFTTYRYSPLAAMGYGLTYAFSQAVIFIGYAVTFRFGAYQSVQPINDPFFARFEHIYTVFMALIFGSLALGQASGFAPNYSKAKLAAKRVFELLDRRSKIDSSSKEGYELDKSTGEIFLNNVCFSYPSRPGVAVMSHMTLSAPANKTTAIVGPSGYGKSTVMSLIQRFYDPLAGLITFDGKDIATINISCLRSQIGIVFQEPVLFDRTIADNIKYGANFRDVSLEEIIQAAKDAKIHDFIVNQLPMGYETIAGEKGTLLSRGQKQRIAIARALLRNPKLLLLDEATSALDPESEKEVQKILDEALKDRTSIVIAHRLSTVCNADKIAVVSEGRVSEEGTHAQLMEKKDGLYHKMYQYQTAHTSTRNCL